MITQLTKEQKHILKRCLWDMRRTPEEFYDIIKGRSAPEWPSRAYCIARLLEYNRWNDVIKIFDPQEICVLWTDEVKHYIRAKSITRNMDVVCRTLH